MVYDQYTRADKLEYAGKLQFARPFNKNYITVDNKGVSKLEEGEYTYVVYFDGKIAGVYNSYMPGDLVKYKADITINGGRSYTNGNDVDINIKSRGYTLMKAALSEADLESAEYEPIANENSISIADKTGEVTVYVKLANDDFSETEEKQATITIDREAPQISDVKVSDSVALWSDARFSFKTSEVLKNAMAVIETIAKDGTTTEKVYPLYYEKEADGKYIYSGKAYLDSYYRENEIKSVKITATDRAANKTEFNYAGGISIVLPRAISGKATFDGDPVENASVSLYKVEDGKELYVSST